MMIRKIYPGEEPPRIAKKFSFIFGEKGEKAWKKNEKKNSYGNHYHKNSNT